MDCRAGCRDHKFAAFHTNFGGGVKYLIPWLLLLNEKGNSRSFPCCDITARQWAADTGNFEVLAGSSSADIRIKTNLLVK